MAFLLCPNEHVQTFIVFATYFVCSVGAWALLRPVKHLRAFGIVTIFFICSVVVDNIRPKEKFAYVLPLAPYGQALTTRFNFIPQSAALTAPFKRSLLHG